MWISIIAAAMSSFTFTLSGDKSDLSNAFFPEIILDEASEYSCALLELTTYHSIPNITEDNNSLIYIKHEEDETVSMRTIAIPPGCYEAHEILDYIKAQLLAVGVSFEYEINKKTLKTRIKCSAELCFSCYRNGRSNTVNKVLGFAETTIPRNQWTEAKSIIKISTQDVIRVKCNIVSGSYINGTLSHTIYEFATNKVDIGYKIIEQPKNLIYLPVNTRRINYLQLSLVDQDDVPIDFRGETITCRIHIKKHWLENSEKLFCTITKTREAHSGLNLKTVTHSEKRAFSHTLSERQDRCLRWKIVLEKSWNRKTFRFWSVWVLKWRNIEKIIIYRHE